MVRVDSENRVVMECCQCQISVLHSKHTSLILVEEEVQQSIYLTYLKLGPNFLLHTTTLLNVQQNAFLLIQLIKRS